jgi:F-type H+-transporting ATPase subunit delta
VSESSTLSASVAGRYAMALFDLALEEGALEKTEADIEALAAALAESDDLRRLISSPVYTRDEQGRALAAVGQALGLGPLAGNVVGLMASKRRLFVLPQVIRDFRSLLADHRGEVTAEVTAARPLSDAQRAALHETLSKAAGRDVKIAVSVDEGIIGGLIVKMGSKMIDTSIRSKLNSLQSRMKEAG